MKIVVWVNTLITVGPNAVINVTEDEVGIHSAGYSHTCKLLQSPAIAKKLEDMPRLKASLPHLLVSAFVGFLDLEAPNTFDLHQTILDIELKKAETQNDETENG